jgi:hypothetical protein
VVRGLWSGRRQTPTSRDPPGRHTRP